MSNTDRINDSKVFSLGLVGFPLEHSLSPRLHAAALRAMQLKGSYRLFPIPPFPPGEGALAELLSGMRRGELHGLNVTIPHKETVIPFLDDLTDEARMIGAVNTIFLQDGVLVGDNTDAPGFLADLQSSLIDPVSKESFMKNAPPSALILGAGGAAKAVVYALIRAGWRVWVAARSLDQAAMLVAAFRSAGFGDPLREVNLDRMTIERLSPGIDLVVNATPVGMWPAGEASPWPTGADFPETACLYDLVYNPAETALVRSARAAGLRAVSGLGMLVEQAALSLELWTGMPVPRSAMWDAIPELAASRGS